MVKQFNKNSSSFISKFSEYMKSFERDLTFKEVESWLRKHFESKYIIDCIIHSLESSWHDAGKCYVYRIGPNTTHRINKIFMCSRLVREAWAMIKPSHEHKEKVRFMNYWEYAFRRYERGEEKHRMPTTVLFKRAVRIFNETGFIIDSWTYHFLSMTGDVNLLIHRAELINKTGIDFLGLFSKRYFERLSRKTFLSLPRFHDWLRGAVDLFRYAMGINDMSEKDIRLLGHVCPGCREYAIKRLKGEFRNLGEVSKGAVERYVIDWQNQPKYVKSIPDAPGKRQWQVVLNMCQENLSLPEYPTVDLKRLAINGLAKIFFDLLRRTNTTKWHSMLACRDMVQAMGRQADKYFHRWFKENDMELHYAGQAFCEASTVLSKPWQDFILKFGPEAAKLSKFSNRVLRPTTLKQLRNIVANIAYGSGPEEVQRACYECSMEHYNYKIYLEWLKEHVNKSFESCPPIDLTIEGYRFYKMSFDDVRGPLLGLYTNCCQHPQGYGSECAAHGWESGFGAFYAVKHKGKIIGQSWAWRGGVSESDLGTLCFDNIQLLANSYGPTILKLYTEAAKRIVGSLGVTRVTVGLGYNTLKELEELPDDYCGAKPHDYNGYRDSHDQKVIFSLEEDKVKVFKGQQLTKSLINHIASIESKCYPDFMCQLNNLESVDDI